jgi:hypothetical protein
MSTPLNFKITSAGLAAAASKQAQGLKLAITAFQVSSAYGVTVTGNETVMPGNVLLTAPVNRYDLLPGGGIVINCTLSPQSGPFEFGSIGLFSDTGVMVALASFATPQQKYPSLGQAISSVVSFDCILKLGQGTAIFDLSYANQTSTAAFGRWKDVKPELQMTDQRIHTFFVEELDDKNDLTMLVKRPDGLTWSVQSSMFLLSAAVPYTGLATSSVSIEASAWATALKNLPAQGTFVVEFPGSVFRKVSIVGTSPVSLVFTDEWPEAVDAPGNLRLFTNSFKLAAA